ncbi:MAG: hypothetical protein AAF617_10800 [Bacteroidota bacterium]
MKKKNLQKLQLTKESIANFEELKGGRRETLREPTCFICYTNGTNCPECPSNIIACEAE